MSVLLHYILVEFLLVSWPWLAIFHIDVKFLKELVKLWTNEVANITRVHISLCFGCWPNRLVRTLNFACINLLLSVNSDDWYSRGFTWIPETQSNRELHHLTDEERHKDCHNIPCRNFSSYFLRWCNQNFNLHWWCHCLFLCILSPQRRTGRIGDTELFFSTNKIILKCK